MRECPCQSDERVCGQMGEGCTCPKGQCGCSHDCPNKMMSSQGQCQHGHADNACPHQMCVHGQDMNASMTMMNRGCSRHADMRACGSGAGCTCPMGQCNCNHMCPNKGMNMMNMSENHCTMCGRTNQEGMMCNCNNMRMASGMCEHMDHMNDMRMCCGCHRGHWGHRCCPHRRRCGCNHHGCHNRVRMWARL